MADTFFEGGRVPRQFNRASGFDPGPEPRHPDDPELNFDPPEPSPPGLGPGGATISHDVLQEELDGPTRDSIQQAQDRMDRGETELGDPMLSSEFNRASASSQEIEEVRREEQGRGLDLEPEWDDQAQQEYDHWQIREAEAKYNERWGDTQDPDRSEDQEQAYSDFMQDQNAELEANKDLSLDQGPEHDQDIDH